MAVDVSRLRAAEVSPTVGTEGRSSLSGNPIATVLSGVADTVRALGAGQAARSAAASKEASEQVENNAAIGASEIRQGFVMGESSPQLASRVTGITEEEAKANPQLQARWQLGLEKVEKAKLIAEQRGEFDAGIDLLLESFDIETRRQHPAYATAITQGLAAARGYRSDALGKDMRSVEEQRRASEAKQSEFISAELLKRNIIVPPGTPLATLRSFYQDNIQAGQEKIASALVEAEQVKADESLRDSDKKRKLNALTVDIKDFALREYHTSMLATTKIANPTDRMAEQERLFSAFRSTAGNKFGLETDAEFDASFAGVRDFTARIQKFDGNEAEANRLKNETAFAEAANREKLAATMPPGVYEQLRVLSKDFGQYGGALWQQEIYNATSGLIGSVMGPTVDGKAAPAMRFNPKYREGSPEWSGELKEHIGKFRTMLESNEVPTPASKDFFSNYTISMLRRKDPTVPITPAEVEVSNAMLPVLADPRVLDYTRDSQFRAQLIPVAQAGLSPMAQQVEALMRAVNSPLMRTVGSTGLDARLVVGPGGTVNVKVTPASATREQVTGTEQALARRPAAERGAALELRGNELNRLNAEQQRAVAAAERRVNELVRAIAHVNQGDTNYAAAAPAVAAMINVSLGQPE